jgi:hypothetical protein
MALRMRVVQVFVISLFALLPSRAQVNILTNRYDSARTAANMNETVLNTTNVSKPVRKTVHNFRGWGRLCAASVRVECHNPEQWNAQPPLRSDDERQGICVRCGYEYRSVDARLYKCLSWHHCCSYRHIVGSNSLNIIGNVGVESTPVIDPSTATMYLAARTLENGIYVQRH